ncbi:MAG: hypothetical protein OEV79_00240 [candidate division WOR-3 bacterium]|nr:hypothetical protein [candidate division WOR-3 bacterium]
MNVLIITLLVFFSTSVESDNGLFRASVQYGGGAELITESFALYDRYGDVMYTKRDIPVNTFFINNTGSVFALNEHCLYLYQRDGSEIMLRELVYPNGFSFSPDNSLFFASDRDGLYAYSHDGDLVHVYHPGRLFASTGHGDCVAVISADTLFVYENGTLRDTEFLSSPYAHGMFFSADEKQIWVQYRNGNEIYDTRTRAWVKQK